MKKLWFGIMLLFVTSSVHAQSCDDLIEQYKQAIKMEQWEKSDALSQTIAARFDCMQDFGNAMIEISQHMQDYVSDEVSDTMQDMQAPQNYTEGDFGCISESSDFCMEFPAIANQEPRCDNMGPMQIVAQVRSGGCPTSGRIKVCEVKLSPIPFQFIVYQMTEKAEAFAHIYCGENF